MINFADTWEAMAAAFPDADALAHGETVRSWRQFEERAARLSAGLVSAGIGAGDKVAFYMFNEPAFIEAEFATFKLRAIPCNVNYRYLAEELWYLLDNSDAAAVFVDHSLVDRVLDVRARLPRLKLIVKTGDSGGEVTADEAAAGIVNYENFLAAHEPASPIRRSPDDLWFLYTGGTTGHPKAVMWPHGALVATMKPIYDAMKTSVPTSPDEAVAVARMFHDRDRTTRALAGAPLMHGTSGINALSTLTIGGMVTTLESRSFEADELFQAIARHRVSQLTIVGDAFCRPMLASLDAAKAAGTPHDLSSLFQVVSSGVVWSAESKATLLEHKNLTLLDSLGSSEGVGFASNITRRDSARVERKTARFSLGEHARVFADDGHEVEPGSGDVGRLAVGGAIPLGYYKDQVKTDETFPLINGSRWSVPGDYATVELDGTIQLLGRGSVSINSGGEKIYPEEVEEALKTHPDVRDANAVGIPDEKWGQAVCGVVSMEDRSRATDAEIIAHVKTVIASYKAPKMLVRVADFVRSPNGKPDYRWAAATAQDALAPEVE